MVSPSKYPVELRERAVRLTVDARSDPKTRQGACRRIGEQLGVNTETLRYWVANTHAGPRAGNMSGVIVATIARIHPRTQAAEGGQIWLGVDTRTGVSHYFPVDTVREGDLRRITSPCQWRSVACDGSGLPCHRWTHHVRGVSP